MQERLILHVDLDAFFCSVEIRDNPALKGKPVLVGGSIERGVVAAASYEARKYGVFSAMPMAKALRLCPKAIVLEGHMEKYAEASRHFFEVLDDFSPLVEGISVDEAFVDITGSQRLLGSAEHIAKTIKERVQAEIKLVASVGIAPTKFVAKIASDIQKPDGLCIVNPEQVLTFLHPLPVARLWGVGRVTQEKLAALGLKTIGDVATFPELILRKKLGQSLGSHIASLAQGIDNRDVIKGRDAISVGHEETFATDIRDPSIIRNTLLRQADKVARRLRKRNLRARRVSLKIKFADFNQITRQTTLLDPSCDAQVLADAAFTMLDKIAIGNHIGKAQQVRLCGIHVSKLEERSAPRQLSFTEPQREKGVRLGAVLDKIQDRFGDDILKRASHTPNHPRHKNLKKD